MTYCRLLFFCKSKAKHMRKSYVCMRIFSYIWRTTKMTQ